MDTLDLIKLVEEAQDFFYSEADALSREPDMEDESRKWQERAEALDRVIEFLEQHGGDDDN